MFTASRLSKYKAVVGKGIKKQWEKAVLKLLIPHLKYGVKRRSILETTEGFSVPL